MSLWNEMHRGELELLKEENSKLQLEVEYLKAQLEHQKYMVDLLCYETQKPKGLKETAISVTKDAATQSSPGDYRRLLQSDIRSGTSSESATASS